MAALFLFGSNTIPPGGALPLAFSDVRLTPHYPSESPLEDILRLVPPGSDEFVAEKYAFEIQAQLNSGALLSKPKFPAIRSSISSCIPRSRAPTSLLHGKFTLRTDRGIEIVASRFRHEVIAGEKAFLEQLQAWLKDLSTSTWRNSKSPASTKPPAAQSPFCSRSATTSSVTRPDKMREERVGSWRTEWIRNDQGVEGNAMGDRRRNRQPGHRPRVRGCNRARPRRNRFVS